MIGLIIAGLLLVFGLPWLLQVAWNYVVPGLFGLPVLTYWQAFVLRLVTQLLFTSSTSYNHKTRSK